MKCQELPSSFSTARGASPVAPDTTAITPGSALQPPSSLIVHGKPLGNCRSATQSSPSTTPLKARSVALSATRAVARYTSVSVTSSGVGSEPPDSSSNPWEEQPRRRGALKSPRRSHRQNLDDRPLAKFGVLARLSRGPKRSVRGVREHRTAAKTKPKPEIGGRGCSLRYRGWRRSKRPALTRGSVAPCAHPANRGRASSLPCAPSRTRLGPRTRCGAL
jgi:hypothetical protein